MTLMDRRRTRGIGVGLVDRAVGPAPPPAADPACGAGPFER